MLLRTAIVVSTVVLFWGCDYDLSKVLCPDLPWGGTPGDMGRDAPLPDGAGDGMSDRPVADLPVEDLPENDLSGKDHGADVGTTGPGCKTAKHCSAGKWCWDNPFPVGDRIHAIWGSSPTNVFFVGALGMVRQYDGVQWTTERPVKQDLYGVWGSGPTDVWAVGANGTVLRHDGMYWKVQGASTTKDLYGVWGANSSAVWAVGQSNTVLRFDGNKWSGASGPCTAQKDQDLRGVWGSDTTNVYVAACGSIAARWNGSAWKLEHQAAADLYAVWGSGPKDVTLAGVGGTVIHWDGLKWMLQSKPAGFNETLRGVWGSKARAWSVGTGAAVLERSGTTWGKAASPGKANKIFGTNHLYAVWGTSTSNVFAAGRGGVVLRYDGKQWRGLVSGATPDLADVWGSSVTDVLAVGSGGHVLRFDGKQWADSNTPTTKDLNGVWGAGSSTRYVVGQDRTVLQWDAKTDKWKLLKAAPVSKQSKDLHGVWGASPTEVYVVYWWGDMLRFNGVTWSHDKTMLPSVSGVVLDVWGSSANDVYVVGQSGVSGVKNGIGARYHGGTWTALEKSITGPGSKAWMGGVWVASSGHAFIAGGAGKILRCNGTGKGSCTEWQPTQNDLYAVAGRSSLDVFAVGDRGTILHFDGGTWSAQASGTVHDLRGLWVDAKQALAVGKDGTILRRCP